MEGTDDGEEEMFGEEGDSIDPILLTEPCNLHHSAHLCEIIKDILASETQSNFFPLKTIADVSALPPRQYLEETVVPILLQALLFLVKERPPEPINALCAYLLKYRKKFEVFHNAPSPDDHKRKMKPKDECSSSPENSSAQSEET